MVFGIFKSRREEAAKLAEIEKSRQYRESLKQKHGTGGLPSDYKETEQEAFKKAAEWKAANPEVTHINKFGRKRYVPEELPENLRYPFSTIDKTQDFIKFSIFKYKRNQRSTQSERKNLVAKNDNDLKAKRIGDIILPIPANLVDSNNTSYGSPSEMNFMQAGGLGAANALFSGEGEQAGAEVNKIIQGATGNLVKDYFTTQAINSFGGNLSLNQVMARSSGQIINPNMELLFSGPTLRNFSYQFKFTPRFQKEAETVRKIIKAFKRNMAPKGAGDNFLKTPNMFEIQYVGEADKYLNRIKLCALTNVAMNYTGDGTWATYNDGSPISMTMTLAFTELTPVFNEDYLAYDDNSDGVGY